MNIEVTQATPKSLEDFYGFFQKSLKKLFNEYSPRDRRFILNHTQGWSKKVYANLLKKKKRILLMAKVDRKVVGILDAQPPYLGVSMCVWIMVDKKFQGKGVGTELLKNWERLVKKKRAHSIYLNASLHNVEYYKNRGFEHAGVFKKAWFGQDHHILTKQIAEPKEENYLPK